MINNIYQHWLKSPHVSKELKEKMVEMSAQEIAETFVDKKIEFGTAGYRAIMGPGNKYLNHFTYQLLAAAYGQYIKKISDTQQHRPKILIAHDTRNNSRDFSMVVAKVLTSMNIEVYFFDGNLPMPTPIVSYVIKNMKLDGGINITASHNPKNYNGFKAYNSYGGQLLQEESDIVVENIIDWKINLTHHYDLNKKLVNKIPNHIVKKYYDDVQNHIGLNKLKKNDEPIIFTSHHGVCSIDTIDFLTHLGHNIIPVAEQCFIDGDFTNSPNMNPEDNKSFELSEKLADEKNAKLMLAVDPDGDRLAVAIKHHNKWTYLNGNQTGILATYYLLTYKKYADKVPIVISTYVSNNLINEITNFFDGLVMRTATGFKNIANIMNVIKTNENGNFIIGFEEAIGMCISDSMREKDGIAAAALMIEIYKFYQENKMTLIDVLEKKIYEKFGNWYGETVSFTINGSNWKDTVMDIEAKILHSKLKDINGFKIIESHWNSDGNCIEWLFDDKRSWIKFRKSGTEPKFKIYYNLFFANNDLNNKYDFEYKKKQVEMITKKLTQIFGIK